MQTQTVEKSVEQIIAGIEALDLEPIKFKLMDTEEGQGWSREYVEEMEVAYKRFLVLSVKYPEETIAPSKDVDKFWHGHILDTMKYADDCQNVFGYFVHHFPYFGMRGEADAANLVAAGKKTNELYEQEFGEDAAPSARRDAAMCAVAKQAGAPAMCAVAKRTDVAMCAVARRASSPAMCAVAKRTDVAMCAVAKRANVTAMCAVAKQAGSPAMCAVAKRTDVAMCAVAKRADAPAMCAVAKQASSPAMCAVAKRTDVAMCAVAKRASTPAMCAVAKPTHRADTRAVVSANEPLVRDLLDVTARPKLRLAA
jgi:hypothetical protein